MSLKIAFAAVLKAMRAGKGLTQRNLAEVSSRTYVSKFGAGPVEPHVRDDHGVAVAHSD